MINALTNLSHRAPCFSSILEKFTLLSPLTKLTMEMVCQEIYHAISLIPMYIKVFKQKYLISFNSSLFF